MNTKIEFKKRQGERGNVLFLILIAVALFAALSYAVTQSTRSGGGDASNEKSLVSSAALTQYPASLKTTIVRMMVSNNVSVDELTFDTPSNFSSQLTSDTLRTANVFYPGLGGGATYVKAPTDVISSGPGDWIFNARNRVANIGSDATDASAVDIVAILPNVKQSVCSKVHSQLGIAAVPTISGAEVATTASTQKLAANPAITYTAGNVIGSLSGTNALNGQPQGCFIQSSVYYYYHVLVER